MREWPHLGEATVLGARPGEEVDLVTKAGVEGLATCSWGAQVRCWSRQASQHWAQVTKAQVYNNLQLKKRNKMRKNVSEKLTVKINDLFGVLLSSSY